MTKRMTKRAARLPEPNDDPAAAGFAAAKADNLIQGRVRDRRTAEDRGEAIATRLMGEGIWIGNGARLTSSELDDLTAYLRSGR